MSDARKLLERYRQEQESALDVMRRSEIEYSPEAIEERERTIARIDAYLSQPAPEWTKKRPTAPGWYWLRSEKVGPEMAYVSLVRGVDSLHGWLPSEPNRTAEPLAGWAPDWEWLGPLTPEQFRPAPSSDWIEAAAEELAKAIMQAAHRPQAAKTFKAIIAKHLPSVPVDGETRKLLEDCRDDLGAWMDSYPQSGRTADIIARIDAALQSPEGVLCDRCGKMTTDYDTTFQGGSQWHRCRACICRGDDAQD